MVTTRTWNPAETTGGQIFYISTISQKLTKWYEPVTIQLQQTLILQAFLTQVN